MSYSPYAYSTATGTTLGLTKIGGNVSAAVDGTITVGTNEVFTLLTATGQVSLAGAAGAESLRVITQASAVNRVEIKGAIASNAPLISANGSDSLVNLNFSSKGGTGMTFYGNSGANTLFTAAYTSSAVNWLQLANSATGNAVAVSAQGGDSNVNLNLTAYGTTGIVKVTNSVAASSTITGALQVAGGIGANQIYGATIFDNSNRVITTVTPTAGTGINVSSLTSSGPTASFTINNLGVTSLTGAATIAVSASTGSVTLTNLGPTSVSAGTGISVNQSTGSVIVTNAGVTSISTATVGATFNVSTGSVQLSITDTLLNVTARGSTTPSAISITNATASISTTTGALAVTGGVGIGGDLNVGGITTASNMDITSASPSIFSTPTGTVTLGKNAGQMTIAQIAATIDIGGSIIGTQTVSLANSGNASLVNVNIAASVGNGNTRTIAIGANGSGATTVNLYLGSNSTASKTYINTTTAVSASTFSVNGSAGISGSVYAGGPVLINQTSTTTNIGYLTNNQTTAVLSVGDPAGTLTLTKQWAMSTATSTTNNATVDTFRWLDAGGNVIGTSGISGHIYVYSRGASGGANALNAVYTIVSGGNGTTDAVLTSVASHGRGTSPVSSIQVANDGAGGGIKITTTYINNTGVVTGGVTVMSFVGLVY